MSWVPGRCRHTQWRCPCSKDEFINTLSQKMHPFCFCNNLVECQPISIIFGTGIEKKKFVETKPVLVVNHMDILQLIFTKVV